LKQQLDFPVEENIKSMDFPFEEEIETMDRLAIIQEQKQTLYVAI